MRQTNTHLYPYHSSPDQEGKGKVAAKKGSDDILESVKSSHTIGVTALYKGQIKEQDYLFFFL